MSQLEDFLFGDQRLHNQLRLVARIIGRLMVDAPRAVKLRDLQRYGDRPRTDFLGIWEGLVKFNLIKQVPGSAEQWMLACDPDTVTVEDLLLCVLSSRPQYPRARQESHEYERSSCCDIDVLLSQATLEINQKVFQYLRQMPLYRLRVRTSLSYPRLRPANFELTSNE